jgi:hypothetical protein
MVILGMGFKVFRKILIARLTGRFALRRAGIGQLDAEFPKDSFFWSKDNPDSPPIKN